MHINVSGLHLLLFSIVVFYIGRLITRRIRCLEEYNIPVSVTGGLLFALVFNLLAATGYLHVHFDLAIRDLFLLVFFASVGLSSRFSQLISGGKILVLLFGVMAILVICQNVIGILGTVLFDIDPVNGLLAGSIAFAGGHGTAITWSSYFASIGHEGTETFGLIAATFGLVLGGLAGGPVCRYLIRKHSLVNEQSSLFKSKGSVTSRTESHHEDEIKFTPDAVLRILLEITLTIVIGTAINKVIRGYGLILPDFLPVLISGIVIANITDYFNINANEGVMNVFGEISLDLFVVMSLFTLKLSNLTHTVLPLLIISGLQTLFIILLAIHLFFRLAGKNYDAAVMASGFVGAGLGATPVGMANVEAVIHRFGASPKALLIVPLLGSFCTDIINASVLGILLEFPLFH